MNSNYVEALVDEIALEGLDGITLQGTFLSQISVFFFSYSSPVQYTGMIMFCNLLTHCQYSTVTQTQHNTQGQIASRRPCSVW